MLDFTTSWAWLQRNKHRSGQLLLAVIIFAVGWQTGKVMSPYYAAQPIVFEDKPCESKASSGGSPEELQALQEEGRGEPRESAPAEPSPEASAQDIASPIITDASQKLFVSSINSNLYHHKDCSTASRIKPENQIWFASEEEAESAGYSPSKCTRQKLGL